MPMLQSSPLVAPGSAVVAITVPSGELPRGVARTLAGATGVPAGGRAATGTAAAPVTGRVVGLPTTPDSVTGKLALSVEVVAADAVAVASAADVRVVLLDPGADPAAALPSVAEDSMVVPATGGGG